MNWNTDVPKFKATEATHDNRFILAVNVSDKLTDDQIRQQASDDGNPHVDSLAIVRVGSIINTRHLGDERCDQFIDTRSMIRVSLGRVIFDTKGAFAGLEQSTGAFVDCHNLWRLPKSTPLPTPTPNATTPPGTTPPTTVPPTTVPPHTTPPHTTRPPERCKPPLVESPNGTCLEKKDPNQGAGHKGNVPTQVRGTNPPVTSKPEPKPTSPPKTYSPPPAPKTTTKPTTPRTTPPPETQAPKPTDPATGCVPPPGKTTCD
jgi:cell division septation protein DedD